MGKKTYFISDLHLGIDGESTSLEREKKFVRWMDMHKHSAEALYLVGDIFDYWYEYKSTIPKGYSRLLASLRAWRDAGIPIYLFTGNHDMWMFEYFEKEYDIPIFRTPITIDIYGYKIMVGHGDGLGPGDYGYKCIKALFANKFCQALFRWLHPDLGLPIMRFFSHKSRTYTEDDTHFSNAENEMLCVYTESVLQKVHYDYFIFGHRHLPIKHILSNDRSIYFNLGEWLYAYSYVTCDESGCRLQFFESKYNKVFGRQSISSSHVN